MAQDGVAYRAGMTGLIIAVPQAEPVVRPWRTEAELAAARGIPAHITVLFPFLDYELIDDRVLGDLARIVAAHQAFEVQFLECRRFPGVLYLAPVPDAGLTALTQDIARRWPEAPPYEGKFDEVVPHLTVAYDQGQGHFDLVEREVSAQLPFSVRIDAVRLLMATGDCWQEARSLPLGTSPDPGRAPQRAQRAQRAKRGSSR
jgi:2'-5' RNA ligase